MSDQPSRNREKRMSPETVTMDAMRMVRMCAAPAEGLSIKAQIRRAATQLGLPFNRTKKIWYGEARLEVIEWELLKASEQRRAILDEMERKVGVALSQADGAAVRSLEPLARKSGNHDS